MSTASTNLFPLRGRSWLLAGLGLGLLLSLGGCLIRGSEPDGEIASSSDGSGSAEGSSSADPLLEGLTPERVLERVTGAMERPGVVYHQVMRRRQDADAYSNDSTFETWLTPDGRRARKHFEIRLDGQPDEPMTGREIVIDSSHFELDLESGLYLQMEEPPPTCRRLSPAESLVFSCRHDQEVIWELDSGRYDGQPVVKLIGRFHQAGQPEAEIQAEAYYLDPETWLPVYLEAEGVILFGSPTPYEVGATFEHAFIPEAEMPEGFFDPQDPAEPPGGDAS